MNTTATWKIAGREQSQAAGRNARLYVSFALVGDNTKYDLTADHARFLQGLGFSFHTVTLEKGEAFNVP